MEEIDREICPKEISKSWDTNKNFEKAMKMSLKKILCC